MKGGLQLAAVDRRARQLGLTPGLTLADARARVPDIIVIDHDPAADQHTLDHLADACDRYTPLVGLDGEHGLMLDITGCAHIFGGEETMLADILQRWRKAGFAAAASVASFPDTARAVVRYGPGGIVTEGFEEHAVSPLQVLALGLGLETEIALVRAGLKTIGDLAARPRGPLVARFGAAISYRLDRVLGRERASISLRRPVADIIVERQFADPISHDDDIRACLAGLAGEAARLMEGRAEGARCFEAGFFRADGKLTRIFIETARPLRDPKAVMRLFDAKLEGLADPLNPGFGLDLIRLSAIIREALTPAQMDFVHRDQEDDSAASLVEQLSARFSADNVVGFVAENTHIPERAARLAPALTHRKQIQDWTPPDVGEPPLRPVFLFDPPQPINATAEVPDAPPRQFVWRRVAHIVVRAEGPERIAPEWWRASDDMLTRDYYRVEDMSGRRFWVYREGAYCHGTVNPSWFLHGLFP